MRPWPLGAALAPPAAPLPPVGEGWGGGERDGWWLPPPLSPPHEGEGKQRDAAAGARGTCPFAGGEGCLATVGAPSFSPSASSTAIGVLTLTPSVPSEISSFDTLPSSTASTSMVALSVSISAMMSPGLMVWPSLTSHLASLPSSMVGDSAGIRISVGIGFPWCRIPCRWVASLASEVFSKRVRRIGNEKRNDP